ncbi:N-terminal asparagine amidohydrolase family protein, putative isoform 2 [Hibiscus syriacus]|uniref:N-terminal asparagine amidohydrolase family protein, putative isoform 2 n=1 Tax=Hibiscus syriacus TaxID=106335 RepID=A0A6A3A0I2_HIBSY|nr:protein N-terminal asparagine amidohydrolase-like [Hibiscus syriacus]KAE8696819.1 N-terminal asparagine amidohydrolase family protein, putative isoform 2 [Hibiscus syriacus]
MIFVDGKPFNSSSSFSTSSSGSRPSDLLAALLEHPILVAATRSFKSIEERKVSKLPNSSSNPKYVYLFQREYATVDPSLVHFVGTDEATTCVGVAIRNRKNGMTSVAHMDSPKIVDTGFSQMLKLVVDHDSDADLDVHLVGGFQDVPPDHARDRSMSKGKRVSGYSSPLCRKIVETMQKRVEKFHVKTLCVLRHNTKYDSQENAYPIFNGFLVETSSGSVFPASFDRTSRCPDEIVRRLRVSASYEDPYWQGKLLDTYDTETDRFIIAPCIWTNRLVQIVKSLRNLSDSDILTTCSTSPLAEGPDFVENEKRLWDYLISNQDWLVTFPMAEPREFERTDEGGWERVVPIKIH